MRSPTFASPDLLQVQNLIRNELNSQASVILGSQSLLDQCLDFYLTSRMSQRSQVEKENIFRQYVRMLLDLMKPDQYTQIQEQENEKVQRVEERTEETVYLNSSPDDEDSFQISRIIEEQQAKIAKAQQERDLIRKKNKLRQSEKGSFKSKDSFVSGISPATSNFTDSLNGSSKATIKQFDEFSLGGRLSFSSQLRQQPKNSQKSQQSFIQTESNISLAQAFSKRRSKSKQRKTAKSPMRRQKSKEELFEIRQMMMKSNRSNNKPRNQEKQKQPIQSKQKNKSRSRTPVRQNYVQLHQKKIKQPPPQLLQRLISGKAERISYKQAKEQTKRRYDQLPQVRQQKQKLKKQQQFQARMQEKRKYQNRINSKGRRT